MVNYTDYQKFLSPWNFIGGNGTQQVQGQTVTQSGDNYVLTYSFFQYETDIISSEYYAAKEEEQKFMILNVQKKCISRL